MRRLGRAQLDSRHYADAAASYRQALALSPPNADLQNDLGVALQHAGQMDDAISAYEVAVGIDPSYGRAHNNLGLALESRRDIAGAEGHFRLALEDRRVMADAHRYLGNLLERRGQLQEARQHWRQSLEADPHQHDAQALRRRIDEADRALSQRGRRAWYAPAESYGTSAAAHAHRQARTGPHGRRLLEARHPPGGRGSR